MIKFDYNKSYRKGCLVCDEEMLEFVRNHFSEKNPNAAFANKKLKSQGSNRIVPDRDYAIQKNGRFDLGLFAEIENFLRDEQISGVEYSEDFLKNVEICGKNIDSLEGFRSLSLELRDYQLDCLKECLRFGWGTVVSATGSGKSLIQAALLESWKETYGKLSCLLIVPGTTLVHQLMKDFKEYGVSFTFSPWTGENDLQSTEVVIVNRENLLAKFNVSSWVVDVGLILMDECHSGKKSNEITKLISKIRTRNKFGFTGTLPKKQIDYWKIIGMLGPVIYEKDSKSLRDEKYLSNVEVRILKLVHPKVPRGGYKKEREFLENSEVRMDLIVNIANKLKKNVLILVDRLEYGSRLLQKFHKFNEKSSWFVSGEMPVEDRRKIMDIMERENNVVCTAMSSIFSTGINIKNIHYIIFTFGGKSFIRTIQSVGRGLRLHESKIKLALFDLYDNMKYSMEHVEERKQFYTEEQIPWTETIVNLL